MQKLIKTENYLLVVDDSEIIEGDYRVNIQRGYIQLVDDNPEYYKKRNDVFKKVIAHLPLNNSPILRAIDLLPPLEEETDVEKRVLAYIAGYNKAKEKYKYTEEDMIQAFAYGRTLEPFDSFEDFIQSLSQPKMPIGFECEKEWVNSYGSTTMQYDAQKLKPKTTTNSQGQTQWVGKYIYA